MKHYQLTTLFIVVMLLLMLLRRKRYGFTIAKSLIVSLCALVVGVLGTYIMYFLENGSFGRMSFFGAVFFFPVFLFPVARTFRVPLKHLLDYATPAGITLLVPAKLNCYISGCCGGRAIWYSPEGIPTHFPSQLAEMANALLITVLLLVIERKKKNSGLLYPVCLLSYGATRLILNEFRQQGVSNIVGIKIGSFWSIISVVIGVVWIGVTARRKKHKGEL